MDEGEWQTATGGRRKRSAARGGAAAGPGQHHTSPPAGGTCVSPARPPTERQVQRSCALVDDAARELAAAPFWRHLAAQLERLPPHCAGAKLQSMVVYGLGSLEQPGAVHIRYQLAAARLLAAALPLAAAAQAFDPVFTALDRATLAHCSMEVLAQDERGRRLARSPTLFFMPHCEGLLTDALLAANLAAGTLHNVVVLGNRFSGYQLAWAPPCRGRRQAGEGGGGAAPERPSTMLRLCGCGAARELAVGECGFPVASAFNDLGLHWFPPDWQQLLDASVASGSGSGGGGGDASDPVVS